MERGPVRRFLWRISAFRLWSRQAERSPSLGLAAPYGRFVS